MRITLSVLLGGLSILLVGLGLLGTLLGVRATIEQFSNTQTGLIMTGYYLGYIIGTWGGPGVVRRVGHIRSFTAFAALGAATTLLFGLWCDPLSWFFLRVLNGASVVGLYMVVESWLHEKTPAVTRSRIFALYMITTLMALAAGQFLLVVYDPATLSPFALATVLIVLAIVPIAVTRVSEPAIDTHEHLPLAQLLKLSPLGAAGVIGAGIVNGAFWGMTAVFGARAGLEDAQIALLMSATIVGGALLQLPIGHLSDRHDRRTVLLLVSLLGAFVAAIAGYMVQRGLPGLNLAAFLYGGLMFSLYAISVAHTNDHLGAGQVLAATRALLLLYGLGALFGPLSGGLLMDLVGAVGLPYFSAAILLLVSLYGGYRMTRRAPPPLDEQAEFVPLARTSPVVMEMHPQADLEQELDLGMDEHD
ncbi:MAG: MFS transporter [Candidatus Thiodiazotropha sp.]